MTTVETIWLALLIVIVLLLPLVLVGLQRLWRAAWNIEYYAREMTRATRGIESSTSNLTALNATIAVAGRMLETGPSIGVTGRAIRELLAERAGKAQGGTTDV